MQRKVRQRIVWPIVLFIRSIKYYHANDSRRGRHSRRLDHRQDLRHLALHGAGVKEPRRREKNAVDSAESREGDEDRDRPGETAEQVIGERLR